MTGFAGIVSLEGSGVALQAGMQLARLTGNGSSPLQARTSCGVFFRLSPAASIGSWRQLPPVIGDGRYLFATDARLDNRSELGAMLSMSAQDIAAISDGELIMRVFRCWGERGIARCLGTFAFAAWDADERRLTLGRDCLGGRALFYYRGNGFVAFASTLRALLALPQVPRELDQDLLANYLALNLGRPRQTFYRGIERVPSRTLVTVDRRGISHRHYWSPDFVAPPPYKRDEDYVERARELFDQAVATATVDTPRIAIACSGGLDSSAVAATAARLGRAESISCYCVVPPEGMTLNIDQSGYLDERDKVRALARMHPTLDVRFCTEGSLHPFEEDATRFFVRADTPILGPANLGAFGHMTDQIAAAKHRVMLVGNKGNFGLSWRGRYSLLALMGERKFGALAREFLAVARQSQLGFVRTFRNDMLELAIPFPLRRQLYRFYGRDPDSVARFSPLNPRFIADSRLADDWQSEGFDPWFGAPNRNPAQHRAYFIFDHNQFARDFAASSESIYGFETRDPHADRRLLEFLLMVPESLYRKNGIARSFARAVLADRLPSEIINETRKGRQGVTWFRRLDARRREIAAEVERLEASPLAGRLLDLPRLKRSLADWPKDENEAELRSREFRLALNRGIHVGRFIRWVEGGNA